MLFAEESCRRELSMFIKVKEKLTSYIVSTLLNMFLPYLISTHCYMYFDIVALNIVPPNALVENN